MTIEELSSYLLINSNQYFIGGDIEVDETILNGLVQRALSFYGNYRPYVDDIEVYISDGGEFKEYNNQQVTGILRVYYTNPIYDDTEVDFNWDWDRDTKEWASQVSGKYWATCSLMPTLSTINYDQYEFLDLVQGLYLMYIGSSRKSFNMGDLPFENDGADLYNDGKELFETTKEKLSESNNSWWYSIT